jgi:gamma-glutamyl-gamma-aminobutyraldehyde dehydrogenase
VHCLRWHAELIDKLYERTAPTPMENPCMIVREPMGVIGLLVPWNFPVQMAAWKIGPSLAAGNSIVLKPARQTSLSAIRLAELSAEAGILPVFNVARRGPSSARIPAQRRGHGRVHRPMRPAELLRYSAESNSSEYRNWAARAPRSPRLTPTWWRETRPTRHSGNYETSSGSRLIVHRSIGDA